MSARKEEKRVSLFFFLSKYRKEEKEETYLGHVVKTWARVWTSTLGRSAQLVIVLCYICALLGDELGKECMSGTSLCNPLHNTIVIVKKKKKRGT